MTGKSLGEEDTTPEKKKPIFSKGEVKYISKEGIVLASIIVFIIMLIAFYPPSFKDFWTGDTTNFLVYSAVVTIIFTIFIVLGIFVLYKGGLWSMKKEARGFGAFAFGAIMLFFIPFGTAIGVLPGGDGWMGPIHIILLVLGIIICLAGVFLVARDGGFFSVWFFGSAFFWLYGFHEAFKFIVFTGDFGYLDQFLSYEAIGIMLASFILYIYHELKYVYLAYLVDEALEHNENKEYDIAIEILDKALLLYPNYVTALNNKGNVLYRMKDYNYSRECYLAVIDIDPDYRKAKSNLRLANKKLGIKEAV
jgi:hypothetical protein